MKETGRRYITPCCTASTVEFVDDEGKKFLRCQVAGHGWTSDFWAGVVEDINDTGTIVEADGTERKIFWRPEPVPEGVTVVPMDDPGRMYSTLRDILGA